MNYELKNSVPQLRFSGFSEDWEEKKLGNVLKITSAARVHKDEWEEKGVPFYRSSDVVANFKGTNNTKAYISEELFETLSNKTGRVKKGDLLITGGGSIGIPFLMKNNEPLYFKDADLLWIKNTNEISGYFLYLFFITESFRKYLKRISHIGTIAHYTVIQARNTPFQFPTLPEQTKIATFLTTVDKRINLLQKKKTELEQYKKGVMQKLFSQTLRFKKEDGYDFSDWEEKKLGEVFSSLKGQGISKSKIIENGEKECILYGELYTTYSEVVNQIKSKTDTDEGTISEKGDLLVPCSTTTTSIDLANVTALNKEGVLLGGDITILRTTENIDSIFFAYYLSNYKKYELAKYGQGTTIVHLYYNHFKVMDIEKPCFKEQQKIANFLSSIDKSIENISNQIEDSVIFKKGLLQKMFV